MTVFRIETGNYVGNGIDNRAITGLGFQPDFVWIKSIDSAADAVFRITGMTALLSALPLSAAAWATLRIKSLDADGFTIGTNTAVNTNGTRYAYIAIKEGAGSDKGFDVGVYTGDGTDNRNITGLGFNPCMVGIKNDASQDGRWRTDANVNDSSMPFDSGAEVANCIQSLITDGFQVGTDDRVNRAATLIAYYAFKKISLWVNTGSYVGDGTNPRNITGIGFTPSILWVKRNGASSTVQKTDQNAAGSSQLISGIESANYVTAFLTDGFTITNNIIVNNSGDSYKWIAIKKGNPEAVISIYSNATIRKSGNDKTITSNARIKKSTSQTIISNANIKATSIKILTSDAFVKQTYQRYVAARYGIGRYGYSLYGITDEFWSDAYIETLNSKTIVSDALIIATGQVTINSNARIKATSSKTIVSGACIEKAGEQTILSDAFIKVTSSVAINSNAFIKKLDNTATIISNVRIKLAYTESIDSSAYIKQTTRYITSDVRIKRPGYMALISTEAFIKKLSNNQYISSESYVKALNTKTLASDAFVVYLRQVNLSSDSYIKKTTEKTLNSSSHIKKLANEETVTSDAYVSKIVTQAILSDAWILKTSAQTITSRAWVFIPGTMVIYSDACIKATSTETTTSDAYIKATEERTIVSGAFIKQQYGATLTSDACILKLETMTITSDAYVLKSGAEQITSDAYILTIYAMTITSDACVMKPGYESTIAADSFIKQTYEQSLFSNAEVLFLTQASLPSDAYIISVGGCSEIWGVYLVLPREVTITSDAYIASVPAESLISNAWIKVTSEKAITSDLNIIGVVSKTLLSDAEIRRSDTSKPCLISADYINTPILISADYINTPQMIYADYLTPDILSSNSLTCNRDQQKTNN